MRVEADRPKGGGGVKLLRYGSPGLQAALSRQLTRRRQIVDKVARIVEDVRVNGDTALLRYTRKFDRVKLTPKEIAVSEDEINAGYQNIKPEFIASLKAAIDNVTRFYARRIRKPVKVNGEEGVLLTEKIRPLESVGVYVPSGTVPLVSTVYMTVIPAMAAGVQNVYLVTPPNRFKSVDPHILVAANLLKVRKIFKAGGAQAIAALAFGTKTIPRVDKIVGPGNVYVSEAKRQVFGYCDIEMIAGPTELAILANHHSDPAFVTADILAQCEHHGGISFLITPSKRLANLVRKLPARGYVVKVKNLAQGIELVNAIAPEHLQIMVKRPERILKDIRNAGAIFLGPWSPTAVGDYVAGPSHVLPTNGSARFFSGLGVSDFLKTTHVISLSRKALEKVRAPAEYLASLEGLKKHQESIRIRFQ
jgi:histidinol dehydrogenase